jgi:hypothetical protein
MRYAIEGPNPLLNREDLDRPSFDSYLTPGSETEDGNAELLIVLRLRFIPVYTHIAGNKVADADGYLHDIVDWAQPEWLRFKKGALKVANDVWNGELWLWTPRWFDELNYPASRPRVHPNVRCSLRVCEAAGPADAHACVRVVRLPGRDGTGGFFRSNFTLWDSSDLDVLTAQPAELGGEVVTRVPVAHEVGHLLGLHHIGDTQHVGTCASIHHSTWTGDDVYGNNARAAPWIGRNVMGLGNVIHAVNARPWIERMVRHTDGRTKRSDWKAAAARLDPMLLT